MWPPLTLTTACPPRNPQTLDLERKLVETCSTASVLRKLTLIPRWVGGRQGMRSDSLETICNKTKHREGFQDGDAPLPRASWRPPFFHSCPISHGPFYNCPLLIFFVNAYRYHNGWPHCLCMVTCSKGHFTPEPRDMTMNLWEPKRKCPKAVPTHLQNHVVWSQIFK